MRGKHWLKENVEVVLTVDRLNVNGSGDYELFIHPVSETMHCNASKLQIWVRGGGPEIFAGSAIPHLEACPWTFLFKLQRTGEYFVEAKILIFNGRADVHPELCTFEQGYISNRNSTMVIPMKI